jgi:hypothetical protein
LLGVIVFVVILWESLVSQRVLAFNFNSSTRLEWSFTETPINNHTFEIAPVVSFK